MKPIFDDGVHLPNTIIWFDAYQPQDLCFVSHAHVSHAAPHHKVVATQATLKLIRSAKPSKTGQLKGLACPYNRPFSLGRVELELFPAGHIFGSAQICVSTNGRRIVYNGGFSLRNKLTVEAIETRPCDDLIMPAYYFDPRHNFPDAKSAFTQLESVVSGAIADKRIPVVFCGAIGNAQEIIRRLGDAGFNIRAHRGIYQTVKTYRELGVSFSNCKQFRGTPRPDEVIIWPFPGRSSKAVQKLKRVRTILLHGFAENTKFLKRHKIDVGIAFSDSADYQETLDYIGLMQPKRVFLFNGYSDTGAETLRKMGIEAESLTPQQIPLRF